MRKVYILASLLAGGLTCTLPAQAQQQERMQQSRENANGAPKLIEFKASGKQALRVSESEIGRAHV